MVPLTSHALETLSIAILGTRGVPNRYGGFETFAAELGRRLVQRGHRVTVYGRSHLYPERPRQWEGIDLVHLPSIRQKYLETVSHALLSSLHALGAGYDAVLLCNAANAFAIPILRAGRLPVAINVDGIERKRKKWNALGKLVYLGGEAMAAHFSTRLIADAWTIADYYRGAFGSSADVIAYGADFPSEPDSDVLARLGITAGEYVLYVSRFEPENHPLEVVEAYREVRTDLPLVMVGSAPYSDALIERVRIAADERVLFPGAVYDADYRTLQRNARAYVQATEVGGTHPALIEAMGSNGRVLALDTPENREVGGETIRYFRFDPEPSLGAVLQGVLDGSIAIVPGPARARVAERYRWDAITDAYERLFREMV
ncbi:MAG TPA: glycosyltransferase [Thermoanaerobaculia bacterium]|nr:glycosyltransferase [Thermoanaerobaculia bacterium]